MNKDAQRFWYSSQKWMAAAFTAFSDGPMLQDMAVHHAGVATEHLLKAYLASLHPALVVEGRDFSSLLHATGLGAHAPGPLSQTKTIGLVESYVRVSGLLKGTMPVSRQELLPLADARNGVAHAAFHDSAQVNAVFTTCLRIADRLLPELPPLGDFWGRYLGLHDKLLDIRVEAARVQLEGRLARARQVFAERYGHFSEEDRSLVLAAIANVSSPGYIDHDEPATCPACSSRGWLGGETSVSERTDTVVMTPIVFDCPACDLHLEVGELGMLKEPFAEEIDLKVSPREFWPEHPGSRFPYGGGHPYDMFTGDEGVDENLVLDTYRLR
ncbi:hypothetical protein ACIRJR_02545 [Streptomyces sp. NPDC102402]|uniref:hypothetical protein n=1 Tax=Streptomyces sp. NPDC102402 TaxID=3366169 RepID=UPI0038170808